MDDVLLKINKGYFRAKFFVLSKDPNHTSKDIPIILCNPTTANVKLIQAKGDECLVYKFNDQA